MYVRSMSALSRPSQLAPSSVRGYEALANANVLARSLPADTSIPSISQYYSYGYQVLGYGHYVQLI